VNHFEIQKHLFKKPQTPQQSQSFHPQLRLIATMPKGTLVTPQQAAVRMHALKQARLALCLRRVRLLAAATRPPHAHPHPVLPERQKQLVAIPQQRLDPTTLPLEPRQRGLVKQRRHLAQAHHSARIPAPLVEPLQELAPAVNLQQTAQHSLNDEHLQLLLQSGAIAT